MTIVEKKRNAASDLACRLPLGSQHTEISLSVHWGTLSPALPCPQLCLHSEWSLLSVSAGSLPGQTLCPPWVRTQVTAHCFRGLSYLLCLFRTFRLFSLIQIILPHSVDSGDFREGELQQPLLSLVQESDTSPVYGHNELALWQRRTLEKRHVSHPEGKSLSAALMCTLERPYHQPIYMGALLYGCN